MKKTLLKNNHSWLSYLDTFKTDTPRQEHNSLTGFEDFFKANDFAGSFLRHSIPYVYLLDYESGLYVNMSENFGGYKADLFLKKGISHTLEIYQPNHLRVFDKEIFPDRLQILRGIDPKEHNNYIFSYTSSIKNRAGCYESFLQRNCFISDERGNPRFSMGILININHHSVNNPIVQTVEKINVEGFLKNQPLHKKVYYLNEENKYFSKREKEVLLWMAEGLSSKMIACKLNISENTVINHRRNMQDKTNVPNAIALVSFAIKSGII